MKRAVGPITHHRREVPAADGRERRRRDVHRVRPGPQLRTSDGRGPVSARTLAELRRLDWTSCKGVRIPPGHGAPGRQLLTLPELLDLVVSGRINPGLVFDSTVPLDQVAEGYRAMDERRAIKVLVDLEA